MFFKANVGKTIQFDLSVCWFVCYCFLVFNTDVICVDDTFIRQCLLHAEGMLRSRNLLDLRKAYKMSERKMHDIAHACARPCFHYGVHSRK